MEMLRRSRAQADPSAGSAVVLRNHPAGDRVDMFFRGGGLTGLRGGNCAGLGPCDDGPRGGADRPAVGVRPQYDVKQLVQLRSGLKGRAGRIQSVPPEGKESLFVLVLVLVSPSPGPR